MDNRKEFEDIGYERLPFDIIETGISLDLIIPKHKDMSTEVICSICLAVIYDPIMCSKCENIFCRSCINSLLKKSFKCPNKCIFEEKEVGRVLKNLLNKFELQCYFVKNGCSSILLYGEFIKHCNNCDYGDFKCLTDNCDFVGIKKEVIAHVQICPLKLLLCKYCKEKIYQKEFEGHTKACESKLVNCKFCNVQIKNKALEKHMNEDCDLIEIECSKCYSKFIKKNYKNHDNADCLLHQVTLWKNKASDYASEIDKLKKELIEAERKNQRYINISAKLLQNPYNSSNLNLNVIRNGSDLLSEIEGIDSNENQDTVLSPFNASSNSLRIANSNQLIQIHQMLNEPVHSNNGNNIGNVIYSSSDKIINNKYRTEPISTKSTLSGLVYSIIDLSEYMPGLICCGNFNSISFFQMPSFEHKFNLDGHTSYIWSLVHLKTFKLEYIASGSQDMTIKIWDMSLRQCQKTLKGHQSWVVSLNQIAYSNKYLLSTSHDNTLRIWDLSNQIFSINTKTIPNVYGKLCGNASSFNPSLIVYGNNSHNVILYDCKKETIENELKGHSDLVNHFVDLGSFQRNYIGTGSDDTTIKIWNIQTGNMVTSFHGHSKCINILIHLSHFEDNSIIASGSDDRTVRLWSLSSSQCVSVFVFESWVKSMLHSKLPFNENVIIVHGQTNVIKLLNLIKS